MKRIGVTGGRDYEDKEIVFETWDFVLLKEGPFVMVNGLARGADWLSLAWYDQVGREAGCMFDPFPAYWGLGRMAGPIRNKHMLDSGLDALVAFPGGRGTADMVTRAKDKGVPIYSPVEILRRERAD